MQKMKKRISIVYELCVLISAAFFFYLCCFARNELIEVRDAEGCIKLEEHVYTTQEDAGAPVGQKEVYLIHPQEIPEDSSTLVFRTIHQNAAVYIDHKLVFSIKRDTGSAFGRSPGNRWNTVLISQKDQGKEVRVEIQPVYETVQGVVPDFYVGSRFLIYMEIVKKDAFAIFLSVIAILLGVGFMGVIAYGRHNFQIDESLFMMGQFAVMIGIWKLTDTGLFGLICGREEVVSYLTFLSLSLAVVPFTQYIRTLFSSKDHWIWNLACIVSLGVFFLSMGIQLLQIADLREILWMTHLSMVLMIAVVFPMLYREVRTVGWNRKLKALVICMGSCLLGLGADIMIYYISGRISVTNLGMVGFLVYIIVLGIMSLQDVKRLMAIGRKAQHFERMAYHDQLTGLYNRAAYADDTEQEGFVKKDCIIIMFDLNNLKYCNDTFGHDKGDLYITSCAEMIKQVFGSAGKCYRLGGDEFCVMLKNKTMLECGKMVQQLKKDTEEWNRVHQEPFLAMIAAGYAMYDETLDYNISDTRRRADKMMYRDKYNMKHESGSVQAQ